MIHRYYLAVCNPLVSNEGAAMAEYGLLAALVAVVCVAAVTTMGANLSSFFTSISSSL